MRQERSMNHPRLVLSGAVLTALPSGALWWEEARLLCVSDLHLGKCLRPARAGGPMLPPYETVDTLTRLDADLAARSPETVVCLGDSFDDDLAAGEIAEDTALWLARMQAGRRWIWIEGNHDAGRGAPGGTHRAEHREGPLVFRHVAKAGETGEISGHYHPKASVAGRAGRVTRACFLHDRARAILPAYGTYAGGLRWTDPVFARLLGPEARAILTGPVPLALPLPRDARAA
jgi:DNA ligase-associated metallophosphoesterase